MNVQGILSVIVTPFDRNGGVDLETLDRLIEHLIERGVHCIIPCGTTGEYYALRAAEREAVMRRVADRVNGRVELLAGTNAASTAEVVEQTRIAKDLGFSGVLLAAPYYSLPTPHELVQHYRTVAADTGMPIMLYNFPARTGVDLGPEVLAGLHDVEEVFGIKESSGSIARFHELLTEFSPRYQVICGADDQALEYFLWGSSGWVAGASNFLPAEHVALYDACVVRRDLETGLGIMRKLLPLFMLMEGGGKYIQYCKFGCELAGVPVGEVRAPLTPLTSDERQRFAELYEKVKA